MRPIFTPMSAAVSRSWKVARIARPSRVRWMRSQAATISASAVTTTNTRSGAMLTGPSVKGAVGKGWGIDLATPPHTSSSPFCMAIQSPIMTSMVVSIDWPRSGASSRRSQAAPATAPSTMASGQGHEEVQPAQRQAGEGQVGPQRVELAVGEVDEVHEPEDQGEADAEQRIGAAQHQAIHQVLQERVQD